MKLKHILILLAVTFFGAIPYYIYFAGRNLGTITGQVLDQDGNPVSGVTIYYEQHERRHIVPIPFSSTFRVGSSGIAKTDSQGIFTLKRKYEWTEYTKVEKDGYHCDSLEPTYRNTPISPTLWLYKVNALEGADVVIQSSEKIRLRDLQKVYFSINKNEFTDYITTDSDLEIGLYKRIGRESYPLIIRSVSGGIFCSRNDMLYAPQRGYEPGIILNSVYGWNGDWVPFYHLSRKSNIYSRIWLRLDARKKSIYMEYAYNKNGSRYIDFDFHKQQKEDRLTTFGHIERALPIESEWWQYPDLRRFTLITSAQRLSEIWKDQNGEVRRIRRFLANCPFTPVDLLSEIAQSPDITVTRLLLQNPIVSDAVFGEALMKIHINDRERFISERNDQRSEWKDFFENFMAEPVDANNQITRP
jgi:hypothetical protein